jgi:hypothetical protein
MDGSSHRSDLIWPKWSEYDRIWMDSVTDPASFGQNGWNLAKHIRRNPTTATRCCRISATIAFSPFVIFSCKSNVKKYFTTKLFYVKTNKALASWINFDRTIHLISKKNLFRPFRETAQRLQEDFSSFLTWWYAARHSEN